MNSNANSFPPDAATLAQNFRDGLLSPSDALADYRLRIQQVNSSLNAFVTFDDSADEAAQASAARYAAGSPLSPLDGVPIAVKDNLMVRGVPATWGCRHYAQNIPDEDEYPIGRLRSAGLVIVGKTNVPEFTLEGYTGNPLFGVTGNPWDPTLTPGGSSGGSAAAVAAGMVPLAIGTDGGGSIRRPAAYTGLVGLKPSIGQIARGRGLPQILHDFEVVGTLTRTTTDMSLLFNILAGADRRDHFSRRCSPVSDGMVKPRILYVERFGDAPLDSGIANSVGAVATAFEAMGCMLNRGALPIDIDDANAFWQVVGRVGLANLLIDEPSISKTASPKYLDMAKEGLEISAATYQKGLLAVSALRDSISEAFADFDFILTPTCAAMPWPKAEAYPSVIDDETVGPRGHAIYTGWVNVSGHPAISLPANSTGLPIGFQLIGDMGSDWDLIDFACRFEANHPWASLHPDNLSMS